MTHGNSVTSFVTVNFRAIRLLNNTRNTIWKFNPFSDYKEKSGILKTAILLAYSINLKTIARWKRLWQDLCRHKT